ncbi:hypothetical protein [Microseira wollei]|uniref:hypothetical protein n=1 Tax=Microseira wollei TaxID=467598 RepID=UPI001CFEB892|nr:hypothetical protein [Microseira wollei]
MRSLSIPPILKDFALTLATGAIALNTTNSKRLRTHSPHKCDRIPSHPPIPKDLAHHLPTGAIASPPIHQSQ